MKPRLPFGPRPLLTPEEKYGCRVRGFAEALDLVTLPEVDGVYVVGVTSYSLAGVARVWTGLTATRSGGVWSVR